MGKSKKAIKKKIARETERSLEEFSSSLALSSTDSDIFAIDVVGSTQSRTNKKRYEAADAVIKAKTDNNSENNKNNSNNSAGRRLEAKAALIEYERLKAENENWHTNRNKNNKGAEDKIIPPVLTEGEKAFRALKKRQAKRKRQNDKNNGNSNNNSNNNNNNNNSTDNHDTAVAAASSKATTSASISTSTSTSTSTTTPTTPTTQNTNTNTLTQSKSPKSSRAKRAKRVRDDDNDVDVDVETALSSFAIPDHKLTDLWSTQTTTTTTTTNKHKDKINERGFGSDFVPGYRTRAAHRSRSAPILALSASRTRDDRLGMLTGASINPTPDQRQRLVDHALKIHQAEYRTPAIMAKMRRDDNESSLQFEGSQDGGKDSDDDDDDDDDETSSSSSSSSSSSASKSSMTLSSLFSSSSSRSLHPNTFARLRKRLVRRREQRLLARSKLSDESKALSHQQQLANLPFVVAAIQREDDKLEERKTIKMKIKEMGKERPKLSKHEYSSPFPSIALSDDLSSSGGSLRSVRGSMSLFTDQFKTFQSRNLIDVRKKHNLTRRYRIHYKDRDKTPEVDTRMPTDNLEEA